MKKKYIYYKINQGVELHHNTTARIVLSDQSLVLRSVTRASAGDYTCLAANTEGKGTSNPVPLRVQCKYCKLINVVVALIILLASESKMKNV